jgi:GT2 family glycosyltransferase
MSKNISFGAFIITYERSEILKATITSVLAQTFPPEKILIVDNSETLKTQELIEQLSNPIIEYYRVGYNAGPAGGIKIGLERLAAEGYDWIFWGDDDDPPKFNDCFELLLSSNFDNKKIGALGAVGSRLNKITGILNKVPTPELEKSDWLEVDCIAGGMCLMISGHAIRNGVTNNEKLFFSFEDLDTMLALAKSGYKIKINSELHKRYRLTAKNPAYAGKNERHLKISGKDFIRDYYSMRNLLVLFVTYELWFAVVFLISRRLFKCLINIFISPGKQSIMYCKLNVKAIYDAVNGKLGLTEVLNAKY